MKDAVVDEGHGRFDVCVVIPTRNRPELVYRAVTSALRQELSPTEVLVVIDGPDAATDEVLAGMTDPRLTVVTLSRSRGAAGARNAGVRATDCQWIAFLDDDDEWLPDKLAKQWEHIRACAHAENTVFATGVRWQADEFTFHYPARSPRSGERVADYLFLRREPGEGMLAVPTLVFRRDLALEHPLPESLPTHEEYDWFLDLEKAGCAFAVLLEPLVVVHAPTDRTSISVGTTWQMSLGWALLRRPDLGERAFGAFCLTYVARVARRAGGLRLFFALALLARGAGVTGVELLKFCAVWFLPEQLRWRLSPRRLRPTAAG